MLFVIEALGLILLSESMSLFCSAGRTRTADLWVMNPTSYHCSTAQMSNLFFFTRDRHSYVFSASSAFLAEYPCDKNVFDLKEFLSAARTYGEAAAVTFVGLVCIFLSGDFHKSLLSPQN